MVDNHERNTVERGGECAEGGGAKSENIESSKKADIAQNH